MIKVVVVEDNDTIREGLKVLIGSTEGYSCSAVFPGCEQMLPSIKSLNPDILLIDLVLKGISGIEGIRQVKKILPGLTIIILTVYEENEQIFNAICAGASGYIAKKAPPVKLLNAVRDAYEGCIPMSASIARKVIDLFEKKVSGNGVDEKKQKLTKREEDVLNRLVEGNSFKAIADSLELEIETLRSEFKSIYRKLHSFTNTKAIN